MNQKEPSLLTHGNNMDIDRIVFEDEHILVYNKPAGIAVQTKRVTETDLESEVKSYLFRKCPKSEPYLGIVHRIDQPVEGLVLLAKTKKCAAKLGEAISSEVLGKYYLAAVEGCPPDREGELEDYILRDGRTNISMIGNKGDKGAAFSKLRYTVISTAQMSGRTISLLDIRLYSGRHHQIRLQLSNIGCPIIGDRKYNMVTPKEEKVIFPALAAYRLTFVHPVTGVDCDISIRPSNHVYELFEY